MADGSVIYQYQILDKFSEPLRGMYKSILRMDKVIDKMNYKTGDLSKKIDEAGRSAMKSSRRMRTYNNSLSVNNKKVSESARKHKDLISKLNSMKPKVGGGSVMSAGAGAIGAAVPLKAAVDFEFAMAKVAKASGIGRTTKEFAGLNEQVIKLSKETGIIPVKMAGLFEAAAKTGMKGEDLEVFTDRVAKMSMALDLVPEEAGKMLAQMKAQLRLETKDITDFTDAINYLGDKSITNGEAIIEVLSRVSGQMNLLEVPPHLAAGMATFARVASPTTELAASGLEMVLAKMQEIPVMRKALLKDPEAAFSKLLTTLSKMDKESRIIEIQDLFGADAGKFLLKAVEGVNLYGETMDLMRDKTKRAGSVDKEFNAMMKTSRKRMDQLKASFFASSSALGDALLPATIAVMEKLIALTDAVTKFANENPEMVKWIGYAIVALVGLKISVLAVKFLFGELIGVALGVVRSFSFLKSAFGGLLKLKITALKILPLFKLKLLAVGSRLGMFAKSIIPVLSKLKHLKWVIRGLVGATGIGALLLAADLLISNWGKVSEFLGTVFGKIKEWYQDSLFGELIDKTMSFFGSEKSIDVNNNNVSSAVSERISRNDVNINGSIGINATGGDVTDSYIDLGGNSGNLGFNMGN